MSINRNVTFLTPHFEGGYSYIPKSKASKKVVAAQQIFDLKALHITTYVETRKLAELFG